MRLKTKLVLASTVFSTVLTLALLSIFFVQLLRVRLEAAKRKLGLMSRDWSLRCDLFEKPAADPRQASLF